MLHIPSNEEIRQLLDRLEQETADDLESEVLEFQSWNTIDKKNNLERAVECCVCLANALGGVIIFGVHDKAKGRKRAISGCTGYDLGNWREHIYRSTKPSLTCGVEDLPVTEGTLLVVRVPPAPSRPCGTTGGVFKIRRGKSCQPLDPAEFGEAWEPPLSSHEATLLRVAAEHTGDIHLIKDSETGPFVHIVGADDFYDVEDASARAGFLDALESLVKRGHVRHGGGQLYSLTGTGWDEGRRLGAVDRQTRELIRRQALARFSKEAERWATECTARLRSTFEELTGKGLSQSSVAAGKVARCISDTIEALARARIEAEMATLQEGAVSLDHARAEALKREVSDVISRSAQEYLTDGAGLWHARLVGEFQSAASRVISQRACEIEAACLHDIEIALNAELLKARKPRG